MATRHPPAPPRWTTRRHHFARFPESIVLTLNSDAPNYLTLACTYTHPLQQRVDITTPHGMRAHHYNWHLINCFMLPQKELGDTADHTFTLPLLPGRHYLYMCAFDTASPASAHSYSPILAILYEADITAQLVNFAWTYPAGPDHLRAGDLLCLSTYDPHGSLAIELTSPDAIITNLLPAVPFDSIFAHYVFGVWVPASVEHWTVAQWLVRIIADFPVFNRTAIGPCIRCDLPIPQYVTESIRSPNPFVNGENPIQMLPVEMAGNPSDYSLLVQAWFSTSLTSFQWGTPPLTVPDIQWPFQTPTLEMSGQSLNTSALSSFSNLLAFPPVNITFFRDVSAIWRHPEKLP